MLENSISENEKARLLTANEYKNLGHYHELDKITKAAGLICDCETSFISLLMEDKELFISKINVDKKDIARNESYTPHTILSDELFILEHDFQKQSVLSRSFYFSENAFYASAPLLTSNGYLVGSLSVLSKNSKKLNKNQKFLLKLFSHQIMNFWDLKKKEQELRISEEKRTKIFNHMVEGMMIQNDEGKIVEINPSALKFFNLKNDDFYQKDFQKYGWKSIRLNGDVFPLEEYPGAKTLHTGKSFKNVIMGINLSPKDMKWITMNSVPVSISNQFHAVTTFQDITELIKKKSELESYVLGIDTQVIVAKTDIHGNITFVNDLFCKVSGYSRKEIIGKNHRVLNSGFHDKNFFKNMWETISSGKIWRDDILNKSKDGRNFWVDTTITPLVDRGGKIREYISFKNDITKRKMAQIDLKNSENKLRQIFEQSQDAVMTLAPPMWFLTSCNPATLKLFHVQSEQEFKKLRLWDISPFKQPDGELSTEKAKKMISIALEKGSHLFEWMHKTFDGKEIPCTILLSRINEDGNVYLHGVVRDISQQKQLENSLIESNHELENSLSEQRVLKDILNMSTDYSLCLSAKLKRGLQLIFELSWLHLRKKGAVFFLQNDQNDVSMNLSRDVIQEVKSMLKSRDVFQLLTIDKLKKGEKGNEFQFFPIIKGDENILGVIALSFERDLQKYNKKEAKFLKSVANIFSTIIQTDTLQKDLLDSNSYLDLALEGAGLGIWDWNLIDNSVRFDRRWAEMLGLKIEEIPMELSTWESRVHPDDLKKCYSDIKNYMDGKTSFYENIHRIKHADGHWVYILDRGRFSKWDDHGKPIRFTGTHFDVSELEGAKQKLSLLYQNSPFGFAFCDLKGHIIDVNKKYQEITGFNFDELKVRSFWEFTPKKYENDDIKQMELLKQTGKYGPYRKEYRTKSGKTIPVELNGFVVKNFDGKEGIWSIIEDISEKIKSEKELSLILEGNKIGIWKYNLIEETIEWDKSMFHLYGMDETKFTGSFHDWSSALHPDYKEKAQKELQEALEGISSFDTTFAIITPQGETRFIQARAIVEKDDEGNPKMMIGINTDITDLKKAQDQKLNELNDILSSTPSSLIIINKKGCILEINSQGLRLIEADDSKIIEQMNIYDIISNEDRHKFKEFNEGICSGKKGSLVFKMVGLKGKQKWIETYAAPYKLVSGEIAQISITNDITQRILAEEEYEKQKSIAHHQAKLASIGELAAGVGHEINNPLAIVKGYLSTISRMAQRENLGVQQLLKYIEKMNVATDRIGAIVQGLRTFSRSDSSEIEDFSPVEAITESLNMVSEIYQSDGVNISLVNESSDHFLVHGNRGKFQQVLLNLISNAKDATIGKSQRTVEMSVRNMHKKMIIEVKDNGVGIPASLKEKIFDPFFTTKEVNKGTGIGLALVHNFIKEMNGVIHVESEENNGATFIIEIPASPPMVQNQSLSQPRERYHMQHHGTILLVDDELEIRHLLTEILEDFGLKVVAVERCESALELYLQNPQQYDLIISDMKMSGMDGPQLLKILRSKIGIKQPKFIFITGGINMDFENQDNEFNNMIDGYLFKPFDEQKIHDMLKQCLNDEKGRGTKLIKASDAFF